MMQTIDDKKIDRAAQMPFSLVIEGARVPVAPLQKISSSQTTMRVTDITVKPAVEKELPVFINVYTGSMPLTVLEQWAGAKQYDAEFDGSHLIPMWIPIASIKAIQAAIKAESVMFASNQLIVHRVGGKYGFSDTHGRLAIPAKYDLAGDFHEGLARVAVDDPQAAYGEDGARRRYGYVDMEGNEVIPLKYSGASPFLNGVAQVVPLAGGSTIMVNKNGQMPTAGPNAIGWKYSVYSGSEGWRTWESEGLIMSAQQMPNKGNWKYGFWDLGGKIVIPAKYDYASFYLHGKSSLRDGKDWYVADKAGNLQKMGRASGVTVVESYGDGNLALVKKDNACKNPNKAWANTSANILERLCIDSYGYVDSTGNLIISPKYAKGANFSEGVAAVGIPLNCQKDRCNVLFTYIDATGKELMPASFAKAEPYSEGLAAVTLSSTTEDTAMTELLLGENGGLAYIDHEGPGPTSLHPANASAICADKTPCSVTLGPFRNNVAVITVKHSTGTLYYRLDRSGRIYWDGK